MYFWYSAITDLTFGDLFIAIFPQNFNHFCIYLPEALIDMLKHGTIVKVFLNETTWFLFEINK